MFDHLHSDIVNGFQGSIHWAEDIFWPLVGSNRSSRSSNRSRRSHKKAYYCDLSSQSSWTTHGVNNMGSIFVTSTSLVWSTNEMCAVAGYTKCWHFRIENGQFASLWAWTQPTWVADLIRGCHIYEWNTMTSTTFIRRPQNRFSWTLIKLALDYLRQYLDVAPADIKFSLLPVIKISGVPRSIKENALHGTPERSAWCKPWSRSALDQVCQKSPWS